METSEKGLLVAGVLLLGLAVEGLKFLPQDAPRLVTENGAVLGDKPYAVSDTRGAHIDKTTFAKPVQFETHAIVVPEKSFDFKGAISKWTEDTAKAAKDQKVKEKAKLYAWVWDTEKNKWVWKKKEKKEEKKDEAVAKAPEAPSKSDSTHSTDVASLGSDQTPQGLVTPEDPSQTPAGGITAGGITPQKFLTLAEWKTLLLTSANATETKAFIAAYKDNMVTKSDFYTIVNLMLQDSKSDMQEQGVLAASGTPSADSFEALATEVAKLQSSSQVYKDITTALNAYSAVDHLTYLEDVFKGSTTSAVLTAALTQLSTAITNNSGSSSSTPNPTTQSGNVSAFTPFVTLIAKLASSTDSSVSSEATQVQSKLSSLESSGKTA